MKEEEKEVLHMHFNTGKTMHYASNRGRVFQFWFSCLAELNVMIFSCIKSLEANSDNTIIIYMEF